MLEHGPDIVIDQKPAGGKVNRAECRVASARLVAVDVWHARAVAGVLEDEDVAGMRAVDKILHHAENAVVRRLLIQEQPGLETERLQGGRPVLRIVDAAGEPVRRVVRVYTDADRAVPPTRRDDAGGGFRSRG